MAIEILDALIARLSTITTVNGYTTDIGLNIQYWQEIPLDYESGGIAIFDQPPDNAQTVIQVGQKHEYVLPVEIQANSFEVSGLSMAQLSCRLIDDLIRCIGTDPTLGGICYYAVLRSTSKSIDVAGKRAVTVSLNVDLKYRRPLYQVTLDPIRV
jgi:hypothetical protein